MRGVFDGGRLGDLLCPGPVRLHRIDQTGHEDAEDDVAVVVAPLGDGARNDGGASRCEGALHSNACLGRLRKLRYHRQENTCTTV